MPSTLDYEALRAQTMGSGNDEAVTVNTRALIDKVLTRYSGEHTTIRELVQNAADASAKKVIIHLETLPSPRIPVLHGLDSSAYAKHVVLNHTLKSVRIENDGEVFKAADWARLKKIAEGNPDETKIGAFGVGFYSVFADCEEPLVSSGREALAFYWKGDSLFTRRHQLPDGQTTTTTFHLPMRSSSSPVPPLMSLCQFLINSLTFVGLEAVELWLDEYKLLDLKKTIAPSFELSVAKSISRKTRDGLMRVASVTKETAQIDAAWLKIVEWNPKAVPVPSETNASGPHDLKSFKSFFTRFGSSTNTAALNAAREERDNQERLSEDLLGTTSATLFVHVNKGIIQTSVTQAFSSELERATKKPPPKITHVSLLSASYDEVAASSSSQDGVGSKTPKIFESFTPVNGKGKVFIGFTTNQTTGLNSHISAPSIIPTVEREAIDLNNRFIRTWNVELIRIAGIVARISWDQEMAELKDKLLRKLKSLGRTKIDKEVVKALIPDALYMHDSYSFDETTPASEVGSLIEESFWTCNQKVAISTFSTQGVLPSSDVRSEPEEGLGFVEAIPVLPQALTQTRLIRNLAEWGVITDITVSDIRKELEGKALNAEQLRNFLAWLAHKARISEIDSVMTRSLLDVAVANDDENQDSQLLVLGECRSYLNTSRIAPEMPIPNTTLPFKFTKQMAKADLETLGFEDLKLTPWLRWLFENTGGRGQLTGEQDMTQNAAFAAAVLPVISKQWEGLSQSSKATVHELLSQRTVMPTKLGMRKPSESYFPGVKLFDDLPVVIALTSVKDKFLTALGVRKTLMLATIMERLMDTSAKFPSQIPHSSAKWSHVDLIKYLASVRADIPNADIVRLRNTPICTAESKHGGSVTDRYLVSELYEPVDALRRLQLRTLQWPGVYRPESPEGRFLTHLGLRDAPTYVEMIQIMARAAKDGDWPLREQAIKYFIDQHQSKGYSGHSDVATPYLPIQGVDGKVAASNDIFVNERATIVGFQVLRRDLQVHALKFGVKQDPPLVDCIDRLIAQPPASARNAREIFSYFATRVGELKQQHRDILSNALIIPVLVGKADGGDEKTGRLTYKPPRMCFLGTGEKYADIFDYVDLGPEANAFLLAVGSKHEPSTIELAQRTIAEPAGTLSILGETRYTELLRSLGDAWSSLKKDKALAKLMKASKFLLAFKEIPSTSTKVDDEEDQSGVRLWSLAAAEDIVIVDDTITYRLFKEILLAAPLEDALENFYHSLGSSEVSSLVEEQYSLGLRARDQTLATKLHRLLMERTRLFLNDFSSETIKRNFAWVQKNLAVECVQSISMRRRLRGYNMSRKESRSAIVASDKPILYITSSGYDTLEVSQALVPMLLQRAKPQSVFMLEMMLESSLNKLRSRGYNVDRILRAKATEARIAEATRKQQIEEEQKKVREQESAWKDRQAAAAARQHEPGPMPGVFPDSPDRKVGNELQVMPPETIETHRPRGLFSGLTRQFDQVKRGLTQQNAPQLPPADHVPAPDADDDAPPAYTPNSMDRQNTSRPQQPEVVTAPHQLHKNLVHAIQSSRGHNSNELSSQPAMSTVKETATYCDSKPGQDIVFVGETNSVRIFLSNGVATGLPGATDKFMAANASALQLFATILLDCADAFSLRRGAVHIFYDDVGSTIAFNQTRALFFNYRYFENLHLPAVQRGERADAIVYWAVVMAHELAHNLVADHSAQHSYYTEALVIQYFGRIAGKLSA